MLALSETGAVVAALLPRWLIIVRRDQPDLYRSLRARLTDIRMIDVIVDRREAERRQAKSPVLGERRKRARRMLPSPAERDHWYTFGYHLVALPAPLVEGR